MKTCKAALLSGLFTLILPLQLAPHSNRTDADDCHANRKTGEYHCHSAKHVERRVDYYGQDAKTPAASQQKNAAEENSRQTEASENKINTLPPVSRDNGPSLSDRKAVSPFR